LRVSRLERIFHFVQTFFLAAFDLHRLSPNTTHMQTARGRAALIPLPMAITVLVLLSTPLWLARAGLYQYLALEIMIWMLFALGAPARAAWKAAPAR
jgi:hypothetical protein